MGLKYTLRTTSLKETVTVALSVIPKLLAWTPGRKSDRATALIAFERLESCIKCPLFDENLLTCGTPGEMLVDGEKLGCWCFMPWAVHYDGKVCWRYEHGDENGWREELNGVG